MQTPTGGGPYHRSARSGSRVSGGFLALRALASSRWIGADHGWRPLPQIRGRRKPSERWISGLSCPRELGSVPATGRAPTTDLREAEDE
jgi:hypothetical protein